MRMRFALPALLAVGATLRADCHLPPDWEQRMHLISGSPAFVQYTRGVDHYDFGCLAEAEAELQAATRLLQAAPVRDAHDQFLPGLASDALELTRAVELAKKGEKGEAISRIVPLVARVDSLIKLRAITAVVPLLDDQSPHWPLVEREIEVLARRGYWQAERVFYRRRMGTGHADAVAAHFEQRLGAAANIHEQFAAAILLADAWRAAGRTLEAWLLIRRIERDAGTDVVDPDLRLEFIRVAAAVAAARAAAGDAQAAEARTVYDAALRELQP